MIIQFSMQFLPRDVSLQFKSIHSFCRISARVPIDGNLTPQLLGSALRLESIQFANSSLDILTTVMGECIMVIFPICIKSGLEIKLSHKTEQ